MMVGAALRGGAAIGGIAIALAACTPEGNGNDIASAFCNACPTGTTAKTYTADDCQRFALEAKCQTWALDDPTIEGCSNSCTFADCKDRVTCGNGGFPTPGPPEQDNCQGQHRGIFSSVPPCSPYTQVIPDAGPDFYVCRCGSGCPCGLSCGVIPEVDPNDDGFCTGPQGL